jgi:hypothetical protein
MVNVTPERILFLFISSVYTAKRLEKLGIEDLKAETFHLKERLALVHGLLCIIVVSWKSLAKTRRVREARTIPSKLASSGFCSHYMSDCWSLL